MGCRAGRPPAHAGSVWAPYGTVLAAYGPFYYG